MRILNKTTIKPVLRFISDFGDTIYHLNTQGSKYYAFTLDKYNGKNSFKGGFEWFLDDGLKYEQYALELATGKVFDQSKNVVMQLN